MNTLFNLPGNQVPAFQPAPICGPQPQAQGPSAVSKGKDCLKCYQAGDAPHNVASPALLIVSEWLSQEYCVVVNHSGDSTQMMGAAWLNPDDLMEAENE